ncbi:MAG: amino acid permease, partial [Anaerohalosphaera sp.]|nr:amino acid permease [Anaerohalosphaera sp.]
LGVKQGKWTQNLLTVAKALGLCVIIVAAFFAPHSTAQQSAAAPTFQGLELAMILVLFTFGGWNEMAYVAAEVKRPERNIARALIVGTVAVTVLYVLANSAFLYALGYKGMSSSDAIAVDTIKNVFPNIASRLVAALICISALGAVNGLIFTGARISYAMGTQHAAFRLLGKWNPKLGTPVWALAMQAVIGLVIIIFARSFIDTIIYTAPVVWIFFLATAISVFVLRRKDKNTTRPWKVPLFPLPTIVFIATSIFMLYNCITFAYANKPKAFLVVTSALILGVIVYCVTETLFTKKAK